MLSSKRTPGGNERVRPFSGSQLRYTQGRARSSHTVFPPIRRVPPEVLGHIFYLSLPDTDPHNERSVFIQPTIDDSPLILGQICREWRQIAYSTPTLWSSIIVEATEEGCDPPEAVVHTWLSRSGDRPLYLALFCAEPTPTPSANILASADTVLRIFIHYISRWHSICLKLPCHSHVPLLGIKRTSAPLLRKLDLIVSQFTNETQVQLSSLFYSAPYLQGLDYTGPSNIWEAGIRDIPWTYLTHIRIEFDIPASILLELLRRCSRLIFGDFGSITSSTLSSNAPYRINNLVILKLCIDDADLGLILNYLALPSLREVEFTALEEGDDRLPWPQASFAALLSRSSCTLSSLIFKNMLIHPSDLIECLKLIPSLIALRIEHEPGVDIFTNELLKMLTYRRSTRIPCLCPRLVSIICSPSIRTSDGVFAEMIESRWNSNHPTNELLASVQFVQVGIPLENQEDRRRLTRLSSEGLIIDLDNHIVD